MLVCELFIRVGELLPVEDGYVLQHPFLSQQTELGVRRSLRQRCGRCHSSSLHRRTNVRGAYTGASSGHTFTVEPLLSELASLLDVVLGQDGIRLVDVRRSIVCGPYIGVCINIKLVSVLEIAVVLERLPLVVELVFYRAPVVPACAALAQRLVEAGLGLCPVVPRRRRSVSSSVLFGVKTTAELTCPSGLREEMSSAQCVSLCVVC